MNVALAISGLSGSIVRAPLSSRSPTLKQNWKKSDRFPANVSGWCDSGTRPTGAVLSGNPDTGLVAGGSNPAYSGASAAGMPLFLWGAEPVQWTRSGDARPGANQPDDRQLCDDFADVVSTTDPVVVRPCALARG